MEATLVLPKAVEAYFEMVNQKDFEQTAGLFAAEGKLVPPFDKPIVGRDAIAAYLTKEASDMTFTPLECEPDKDAETSGESFVVKGKVKNSLFVVNVGWQFILRESGEIEAVKVKLLASLKELMKIRQ